MQKFLFFLYRQFHSTFPRSSAFINWVSVRFYETDCTYEIFLHLSTSYDRPRRPLTLRVSQWNQLQAPAHRSNTVLAPEERFWRPFFIRPKKIFLFIFFKKNGNGRQNLALGAKTGLLRRAGTKTQFPGDTPNVGSVTR